MKIWSNELEAQRLHERFTELKTKTGMGQAEFARINEVPGGPSLLSQHIKNRRPINLDAAIAYAKGFACPIAEISPRIAREINAAQFIQNDTNEDSKTPSKSWSPADDPGNLPKTASDRQAAGKIPGYSGEALLLAWLLDQIQNKLDKKKAEVHASAIILDYINRPNGPPKISPDIIQPLSQPKRKLEAN